ncbi:hypothetical protein [Noviherbaspirillum denitrificans]|uniref:hypothetical protein n=1 Tax=Noviherbaspirillum denitrificans TaxID=1968433 RepID=UPI000B5356AA|nr:hypothetical protein [Noviherbaspirillum denitrificans]
MHNTPLLTRPRAIVFGWLLGGFGFLLSFALAVTMLVRQGTPGFLLIWAVALLVTGACMRAQARWRRSLERMSSPDAVRTFPPARSGWRLNVEDIAFRDIPAA